MAVDQKQSAVISRDTITKKRGSVERASAFVVLALSFVGSMVALAGGWGALANGTASLGGAAMGMLLQIGLTWAQWGYGDVVPIAWPARAIDAGLTAWGFGPLFAAPIQAALAAGGASTMPANALGFTLEPASASAWAIIYVVSLLIAWYPESRLIK